MQSFNAGCCFHFNHYTFCYFLVLIRIDFPKCLSFNTNDVPSRWRDFVNRQNYYFDFTGVLAAAVCTGRQTWQGSSCQFHFSRSHTQRRCNACRFPKAVTPLLQIITACKDHSNLALTQQSHCYRANPCFYVESFWVLGWILWPGVNKTFYRSK